MFFGFLKYVVKPLIKGAIGEKVVSIYLSSLPKDKYILLNDIMLKTKKGSTQIDHILVSIYGIFVIETKNYNGWIYGRKYDKEWTQNIYGNKKKFYNPLRQNYGHIKTLMDLLDLPEDKFISVIAFSSSATLKTKNMESVIYINKLKRTILGYQDIKLTEDEINEISEKIKNSKMVGKLSNRIGHVKNIKSNMINDK